MTATPCRWTTVGRASCRFYSLLFPADQSFQNMLPFREKHSRSPSKVVCQFEFYFGIDHWRLFVECKQLKFMFHFSLVYIIIKLLMHQLDWPCKYSKLSCLNYRVYTPSDPPFPAVFKEKETDKPVQVILLSATCSVTIQNIILWEPHAGGMKCKQIRRSVKSVTFKYPCETLSNIMRI